MRKTAVVVMLAFVLSTVTAPARAFLPAVVTGASLLFEGSMAANAVAALTVGGLVGTAWLVSQNNGQLAGAGNKAGSFGDFELFDNGRPLDRPNGWGDPSAASGDPRQPTPPSPVDPTKLYSLAEVPAINGSSPAEVCANTQKAVGPNYRVELGTGGCVGYYVNCCDGAVYYTWPIIFTNVCADGYIASGNNSCILTDASKVPKPPDGRCQILASVAGFTVDPRDPECGQLSGNKTTVTPTSVSTTSGTGDKVEVTANADGSRTIRSTRANADGTSTITNITVSAPAAGGSMGTITGTTTTTVAGTGTGADTAPTVAPPIKFPDDYNREITQQLMRSEAKTYQDAVKADRDSAVQNGTTLQNQLSGKPANQLPPPADIGGFGLPKQSDFRLFDLDIAKKIPTGTSCQPIAVSIMGQSTNLDVCPVVAVAKPMINWMVIILGVMSGLLVFLRSEES